MQALKVVDAVGIEPEVRHLSNSAAAVLRPWSALRPGPVRHRVVRPVAGARGGDLRRARAGAGDDGPRAAGAGQAADGRGGRVLRPHLDRRGATPPWGWCPWGTATGCRGTPPRRAQVLAAGAAWAGGRAGMHGPARRGPRRRPRRAGRPRRAVRQRRGRRADRPGLGGGRGTISYEIVTRIGGRFTRRHVSSRGTGRNVSTSRWIRRRRGRRGGDRCGASRRAWSSSAGSSGRAAPVPPAPTSSAACAGRRTPCSPTDGVRLHAEVDEVAPYDGAAKSRRTGDPGDAAPTVVFVHGYALNLDCWHFQRAVLPRQAPDGLLRPAVARPVRQAPTRSTPPSTSSATTCAGSSRSWCRTARSSSSGTRWAA